ncbi:RNA methyltransferase tRNA(m5U54)methyltransferase [Aspergillus nanangensis]|uniref:tRNA (guanine(26)-N(2))-dimethyltransferase n=1 Tax=Aspergillus nanangensis TaxID=2582783 RepID=A0AAD4GQ41_ASPNN|nr:RNA methyltransferase tRNA(m5U54)methyltransferase [Aspergillus nanangensis]
MEEAESIQVSEKLVQFQGKEYRAIKEGRAYILNPPAEAAASEATKKDLKVDDVSQSVFYNPIQQFNRDLSVLAIRAHGAHVQALRQQTAEKKKNGLAKGKKRKRDDQDETKQDPKGQGEEGVSQPADQLASDQTPGTSPTFAILDALSATGLRALRYASEVPFATCVVANDLSASAIQSMKMNIEYNELGKLIQPNNGDARAYMYSLPAPLTSHGGSLHTGKFDVIDLDPYGSAGPFMDATVQAAKDGGMLCVTCTDAGVWASNGYPEKAFALYGGVPIKGSHSHEGGLRLILNGLAVSAAKYGLAIEPLLSLSIDFYARVFVRIHRSPAEVKFLSSKTMMVYNCDAGCGAWKVQPLTQLKSKLNKNGKPFYHHGFAQGPLADHLCSQCNIKTHLAGPMWGGPLHNPDFIQKILDMLPGEDRETYRTLDRIEGMLTTALEEDLSIGDPLGSETPEPMSTDNNQDSNEEQQQYNAIIPRLDPAIRETHPFYFTLSSLSKVLHTSTLPFDAFRGALRHLGYRATRSHAKPNTVRTDAPWEVIWEVMREWVRQKSPIKEGSLKPGTAGATIMAKACEAAPTPEADDSRLQLLKEEILSAVASGNDVADLVTKIEATLYRSGSRQTVVNSASESQPGASQPALQDASKTQDNRNGGVAAGTTSNPSKLEVVFDEALGRETFRRKRLVRYQLNPRANWGPLNRASGKK